MRKPLWKRAGNPGAVTGVLPATSSLPTPPRKHENGHATDPWENASTTSAELTGVYHPDGRNLFKRDLEMPDSECNMDYFMKDNQVMAGDPDQVVKELLAMTEESREFEL